MHQVNQASNTKRQPEYLQVKAAINEAVQQVFPGGHVQVQPQGSTAKGTALPSSDWDFFLRMDNTIDAATKAQRVQLANLISQQLSSRGLQYRIELHSNCTRLRGQGLPDVDIILQRFKGDQRLEPNSRALADSHVRQQVVKEIKLMPSSFTNLTAPKSSRVEEFARLVEVELRQQQGGLSGKDGFGALLGACLGKIGRWVGTTTQQEQLLVQAGMREVGWERVARKYFNQLSRGG